MISSIRILMIVNDQPYGRGRPYDALRLAGALAKDKDMELRMFLLGDTVPWAHRRPPGSPTDISTWIE